LLASFGRSPLERNALVHGMLAPKKGDAAGYWLQLTIATMLATLGLALNSTAVVIGAMLIAPLMKPLVDLAMGLATGSAALALRATIRTLASIAVVVVVAALITWLLPFHEITSELEARTAPTLLDLAVAAACALAAAYATLRSDAEIATTAAGTSIGISLVPPLCACGYGLALGDMEVSRGAALLFTANLSGILALSTIMFVCTGFARVDIRQEEADTFDALEHRRVSERVGQAWTSLASKRLRPIARIVPPLLLIAIVFFPLQRAVGEIQHRSVIRQAVSELLGSAKRRVVQYTLDHTSRGVIVRVVVLGDSHTASDLEQVLRDRLARLDVKNPTLSVWAVPDAASVSALAHRIDDLPPPVAQEPVADTVHRYSADLAGVIRRVWPNTSGVLVGVELDLDHPDHVHVTHLGTALGPSGLTLLASAIEPHAGPVSITEDAFDPIVVASGGVDRWLVDAAELVGRARRAGLKACITMAPPLVKPTRIDADADVRIREQVHLLAADDVTLVDGDQWRASASVEPCVAASPAPSSWQPERDRSRE
jgi:uncharacterized hydrophobic protein (TIGR00271 family)